MRDVPLTLFLFGSLVPAMRWPWIGTVVFAWVSMMNLHRLTWGFAYDMPFAAMVAGATLLGWVASRESKSAPKALSVKLFIAFGVWISITTVFAKAPDSAFAVWTQVLKIFLLVFVTMTTMTEKRRIIILTAVGAVSIGFYGIKGGVHTIMTGVASRLWGPGGFIGDNNALALALVVTLPLFRYLHAIVHKPWLRWILVACMGLTLASVIGTQSRGAFLVVSAMLMFMLIKSRQKVVAGLVGLFFVGLVVGFAPDSWTERMETIKEYEEDGSSMSRLESWGFNLDIALVSPLVGGGFDVYKNEALYKSLVPGATINRSPHSIYFEVLGYHGFVGLALFLALFFATFRMAGSLIKLARGKAELFWAAELGAMLQVSLVGYAVGGAFLNLAFFDLPYYLMAITVCATAVVQRTLADRQQAQTAVPAAGPPFLPTLGPAMGPR